MEETIMRKQYIARIAGSFRYSIELYHDGHLINVTKKWSGDEFDDYMDIVRKEGYTRANTEAEIQEAKEYYENIKENQLQKINDNFYTLTYNGQEKECVHLVDESFLNQFNNKNKFGYYKKNDECVFFITDAEGKCEFSQNSLNERMNKKFVDEFLCAQHIKFIKEDFENHKEKYKKIFKEYIGYNFESENVEDKWEYFNQNKDVLVEFLYFIMYNRFVVFEQSINYHNSNALSLCQETDRNVLNAYGHLVYLSLNETK